MWNCYNYLGDTIYFEAEDESFIKKNLKFFYLKLIILKFKLFWYANVKNKF
jgi:hypothetical protein